MAYEWQLKQKEETRQEILGAASRLLFQGIRKTSVSRLMKAAGLTVGGFYAHFRSKDELVLECFRKMLSSVSERLKLLAPEKRKGAYKEFYLSAAHRDEPESGCPVLALVYDAAGKEEAFRRQFAKILESALEERLELFQETEDPAARERLLAEFSSFLGAQLLARATRGTPLSDRILAAAKGQR